MLFKVWEQGLGARASSVRAKSTQEAGPVGKHNPGCLVAPSTSSFMLSEKCCLGHFRAKHAKIHDELLSSSLRSNLLNRIHALYQNPACHTHYALLLHMETRCCRSSSEKPAAIQFTPRGGSPYLSLLRRSQLECFGPIYSATSGELCQKLKNVTICKLR